MIVTRKDIDDINSEDQDNSEEEYGEDLGDGIFLSDDIDEEEDDDLGDIDESEEDDIFDDNSEDLGDGIFLSDDPDEDEEDEEDEEEDPDDEYDDPDDEEDDLEIEDDDDDIFNDALSFNNRETETDSHTYTKSGSGNSENRQNQTSRQKIFKDQKTDNFYKILDSMALGADKALKNSINKVFSSKKSNINHNNPRNIASANQINKRSAINDLRARTLPSIGGR